MKSCFPKPLILEYTSKRFHRKLVEDFVYHYTNRTIIVPKGFVTDLASIYVLRYVSPALYAMLSGYGDCAAVIHDYLYDTHRSTGISRKAADKIFYRCLRDDNVPKYKALMFYAGVRIGGRNAWNES